MELLKLATLVVCLIAGSYAQSRLIRDKDGGGDLAMIRKLRNQEEFCAQEDWVEHGGHSYCFASNWEATWDQADAACRSKNGYLVELDDEEEKEFVMSHIPYIPYHKNDYWMGANQRTNQPGPEALFKWQISREPVPDTYWSFNQPSKFRSWNYAACVGFNKSTRGLFDAKCNYRISFACEKSTA